MSDKIDITMTSVVRPKIVEETLNTFSKFIFKKKNKFRLIINIDVIGEELAPQTVLDVCYEYFNKENVIYNISKKPSFSKAVKFVWSKVESDYFFHLEDDWILFREVDINDLFRIMKENKNLASIRFCNKKLKFHSKGIVEVNGLLFYKRDGFYIARSRRNSLSLNPSFIRHEFIKKVLPLMSDKHNPEKQLRKKNPKLKDIIMSWDYGIYGYGGDSALVCDNGLKWRNEFNFRKPKRKFLTWEKNE